MIRAYTYKLLRSPLLYIGIIGIAALCCTEFLEHNFGKVSVLYHVRVFFGVAKYRRAMVVFGALPFAANFADEWTSGIAKECIIRKGIKKYAMANLLFCWFSAILTVSLGMALFMCFDSIFVPFTAPDYNPYSLIFESLVYNNRGGTYLLLVTLVYSASCAVWAVMGMLMSVFFANKYVAICTPFVANYLIERFTDQFSPWFDLHNLARSYIPFDYFGSDLLGFLYCVGLFAAIAAVCGVIFYNFLKRKVQNEAA